MPILKEPNDIIITHKTLIYSGLASIAVIGTLLFFLPFFPWLVDDGSDAKEFLAECEAEGHYCTVDHFGNPFIVMLGTSIFIGFLYFFSKWKLTNP